MTRQRHTRCEPVAPGDLALATACAECAATVIPGVPPYEPGRHMAPVHRRHLGELQARGWTVHWNGAYGDGIPDAVCPHITPEP